MLTRHAAALIARHSFRNIAMRGGLAKASQTIRACFAAALAVAISQAATFAQPVLITNPQTLNPGATSITPTAGGPAVNLATADITVSGTTLTVNGRHTIRDLVVQNNGTVTHAAGFMFDYSGGAGTDVVNGLWLNVQANPTGGTVTVQGGSLFNVTGKGFAGGQGPGAGTASSNGSLGGAGGGHGGDGGNSGTFAGGLSYGSITQPITLGSGGGSYFSIPASAGGGAVRLIVSGALTLNGSVVAAGVPGSSPSGSGAGGSIWITAGSFSGIGNLQASGGGGGGNSWGGGGGGRIAVDNTISNFSGAIQASPGAASNGNGGAGSIYLASASPRPQLIYDGFGVTGFNTLSSPFTFNGDVFLRGGALLTHAPRDTAGLTFNITGDLTVADSSSGFNVTGKGFAGGQGPGAGTASSNGSLGGAGGGHGGDGGNSGTFAGGPSYGSETQPVTLGSGGGWYFASPGGAGGGAVRLIVSGALTLNGSVVAAGIPGVSAAGAGAGGSIWITAGSLSGNGNLQAIGGAGGIGAWGGGGGGRIAVDSCVRSLPTANFFVFGGTASQGNGSTGTVFVDPLGMAIIDQPASNINTCLGRSIALTYRVLNANSIRWQRRTGPGPNDFEDLSDGQTVCGGVLSGTQTSTLSIAEFATSCTDFFRALATNDCGSVASIEAQTGVCSVEFNCDGALNQEDLSGFLTAFLDESITAGPFGFAKAPCPGEPAPYDTLGYQADYNRDCSFNQEDLSAFITDYLTQVEQPNGCVPG